MAMEDPATTNKLKSEHRMGLEKIIVSPEMSCKPGACQRPALYQGTTSVVPKRVEKSAAFSL
jgi:hypothetical protein